MEDWLSSVWWEIWEWIMIIDRTIAEQWPCSHITKKASNGMDPST